MADEKAPPKRAEKKEAAPPSKDETPKSDKKAAHPLAPKRATLDPEERRLMRVRRERDDARPKFTRQASYRYYRIGRDGTWRRPRGQQSKQRRHYKYRSTIVSIGFRSPSEIRGLAPSGFRPIVVRTPWEIEALSPTTESAVIARTVGTKRRLVLEEAARKRGVHIANPITREEE